MEKSKFYEYLNEVGPVEKEKEILKKIEPMLLNTHTNNMDSEMYKTIYGCIDLTSLNTIDTRESIWEFVEKVNASEGTMDAPNVAAICTYPIFVETVKQALLAKDVKIASVSAGFPSSQTFQEVKIAETALAVMAGAEEIDVVLNLGLFLEDAIEECIEELAEIKDSCRGACLKVIIESGALQDFELIRKATLLAICGGADFVKTSTGKEYYGATVQDAYVICDTIKKVQQLDGRKIGIKISGGIRSTDDAVLYYSVVENMLGKEWLNKDLFRIGSSKLANDIEKELKK